MNRFRAYVKSGSFMLSLMSFFISAFFVIMCAYIGRSYTVSRMSSGGFGDNSTVISVTGAEIDAAAVVAECPVGIFREYESEEYTVYFVYASPRYSYPYCFRLPDEGCAVTGYYLPDNELKLSLDKSYTFKVTGKVGYRGVSALGWTVFINQPDISAAVASENYGSSVIYTVDGGKKPVADALALIKAQCSERGGSYSVLHYENRTFADILRANDFLIYTFGIFTLCVIVTSVIFASFWMEKQKQEVYIRRFIGFSSKQIRKSVLKNYLRASNSGFLLAVVLLIPLMFAVGVMLSIPDSLLALLAALLLINLFSVLALVYPLNSFFRKRDINIYLK